jgi:hypothetical protein
MHIGRRHHPHAGEARANALIEDASAAIRTCARQQILTATSTAKVVRQILTARGSVIRLPERPVTAVTALTDLDGVAVDYEWDGLDKLYTSSYDYTLKVTYNHGYGAGNDPRGVADVVKGICANVVARAMGTPTELSGKTAESIGTYSVSIGAGAAQGGFGLLKSEIAAIRAATGYRGMGVS